MSSKTTCASKIVKTNQTTAAKRSHWLAPKDSPEPKVKRQCADPNAAVVTLGIPKKKYSRNWVEEPVSVPPALVNQADPVYDQEGRDIGLFLEQPSDRIVDTTLSHVFEYIFSKARRAQDELERVMAMAKTNGPRGTVTHMLRVIRLDRNLKLTMHHMLMAELARLSVTSGEPIVLPQYPNGETTSLPRPSP